MHTRAFVGVVVSILLTAQAGMLRGQPGKETETERIPRLNKQVGDRSYAKRESASKDFGGPG
jgi:hypothetical protein